MRTLLYLPRILLCLTALLGVGLAQSSQAQTFTFQYDTPSGNQPTGTAYQDTTHTYTLHAYGYTTANAPGTVSLGDTWNTGPVAANDLFGKHTSGDPGETGLGLAHLSENEMGTTSFLQLDVSDLKAKKLTNLTMTVGSIQPDEGFYLWGSNLQGTPGVLVQKGSNPATGSGTQSFLVPGYATYNFFSLSASAGNVLLDNGLKATAASAATPEPGSLALLVGMSITGAGFLARRRKQAKQTD